MILLRLAATVTCLAVSAALLDHGQRGLGWLLLVLGAGQGVDTIRRMLKNPEPPAPPLRRDPGYARRRYIPKPGGAGGSTTLMPLGPGASGGLTRIDPRLLDICDWCHGPLTERWNCGRGSANSTFTNGILTTPAMAGGAGGTWPPPEPGERHQFCSQDHMHAWMDREGWERR